ncbi:hypothetical protein MRX96_016772 [Rhipicephalus microplus]
MNKFRRCEDEERCCRPEGADTGKPAFVVFSEDVADESSRKRRASTADLDPSPTEILQILVYTTWTAEGPLLVLGLLLDLDPKRCSAQAPSLDFDHIWTLMWVHGLVVCCCFPQVSWSGLTRPFLLCMTSIQPSASPSACCLIGSLSSSSESLLEVSPHFSVIYVHFGGAPDPLAYSSAPLIALSEAGVGLVGVGLAGHT